MSLYRFGSNVQTVYIFRIGDVLIDTGQRLSRASVREALGGTRIAHILLTHHHEDHSGNAAWMAARYNARLYGHRLCAELMRNGPYISPLGILLSGGVDKAAVQPVEDGELLDFDRVKLKAVHTPGHTDDHLAFYDADRGWLFPGDLYVADRIKYFETNESIADQIASLEKLVALDFDVLLCSHNPKLKEGKKRLARKLELFREFYGEVADRHRHGQSAAEIFRATGRRENYFYKYLTVGHFSAINMVRSVIRDEQLRIQD